MSSWERSRHLPWSRIPQDGNGADVSGQKERIFRQLQRGADLQEKAKNSVTAESGGDATTTNSSNNSKNSSTKLAFRWPELFKNAAFGGAIGAITGTVFGFMDGMRTAGQSQVLQKASNMAKGRYLLQGTTRSATLFGVFFSGFHILKYGLRVTLEPGEWGEIGMAGAVSLGTLMSRPAYRPSMPYASMLVIMDGVHIVMREFNDK